MLCSFLFIKHQAAEVLAKQKCGVQILDLYYLAESPWDSLRFNFTNCHCGTRHSTPPGRAFGAPDNGELWAEAARWSQKPGIKYNSTYRGYNLPIYFRPFLGGYKLFHPIQKDRLG